MKENQKLAKEVSCISVPGLCWVNTWATTKLYYKTQVPPKKTAAFHWGYNGETIQKYTHTLTKMSFCTQDFFNGQCVFLVTLSVALHYLICVETQGGSAHCYVWFQYTNYQPKTKAL